MKPFHTKGKISHADSGTKNTVMTIVCRMQNLYTNKILETKKVIDNFR